MNLTDTDLVVLEALDFAPACESVSGCDRDASWWVAVTRRCGCRSDSNLCTEHLQIVLGKQAQRARWRCRLCGARFGDITGSEFRTIDRIEAL